MTRYELADWTPAKHPPIPLPPGLPRRYRRLIATQANMTLRRIGTTYIHKGGKP